MIPSLAKNAEIMLLLFTFICVKHLNNFGNKKSEWQTTLHLLLHQETLRVHGDSFSEDYKKLKQLTTARGRHLR